MSVQWLQGLCLSTHEYMADTPSAPPSSTPPAQSARWDFSLITPYSAFCCYLLRPHLYSPTKVCHFPHIHNLITQIPEEMLIGFGKFNSCRKRQEVCAMLCVMLAQGEAQHCKEGAPLRENIGNLQGCSENT